MNAHRYDFHCHVDLHRSPAGVLSYLEAEGVRTLAVTTLPAAVPQNLAWAKRASHTHVGCGLHPELVGRYADSASLLFDLIPTTAFVGEIGIDGSRSHRATMKRQEAIFRRAISLCGRNHPTLVSIHSRGAADRVVEVLEEERASRQFTPILHWYTGSQTVMRRAAEIGCYFSINFRMLTSEQGRRLVSKIPSDRLLSETDAPFTTDGTVKGHAAALTEVELAIAKTIGISHEAVRQLLAENGQRVLAAVDVAN